MPDTSLSVTLVGGPTAVLSYAGLRWITDPTFDPPGRYEHDGAPTLQKTVAPALTAEEVGPVDVALVSHDHHDDNLDGAGRAFLASAGRVLTTTAGAERLGAGATGIEPWGEVAVPRPDGGHVRVTAVPAQHGPDGTDHLTGPVIGFVLAADGLPPVYVSGDNASVDIVRQIVDRLGPIELAVLFAGGAAVAGLFDDALLTLGGPQAAEAAQVLGARAVVPVHQEGWTHFTHPPTSVRDAFAAAGISGVLHEAAPGDTVDV